MPQSERTRRHAAEIAAWAEINGPVYAAWVDSTPVAHTAWTVPANDNFSAANDNVALEDAA